MGQGLRLRLRVSKLGCFKVIETTSKFEFQGFKACVRETSRGLGLYSRSGVDCGSTL